MADILSELFTRHGYGRVQANEEIEAAWRSAAGQFASESRVGKQRRGCLEIMVSNSTILQELTFRKSEILERLAQSLPDQGVCNLSFRVASLRKPK